MIEYLNALVKFYSTTALYFDADAKEIYGFIQYKNLVFEKKKSHNQKVRITKC